MAFVSITGLLSFVPLFFFFQMVPFWFLYLLCYPPTVSGVLAGYYFTQVRNIGPYQTLTNGCPTSGVDLYCHRATASRRIPVSLRNAKTRHGTSPNVLRTPNGHQPSTSHFIILLAFCPIINATHGLIAIEVNDMCCVCLCVSLKTFVLA